MQNNKVRKKWKSYLMATLFNKKIDYYSLVKDKKVDDIDIMFILGIISEPTLNLYKNLYIKGNTVEKILNYLVENDDEIHDIKVLSKLKKGINPLQHELRKKYLKGIERCSKQHD